jgi:hypothetical protein
MMPLKEVREKLVLRDRGVILRYRYQQELSVFLAQSELAK